MVVASVVADLTISKEDLRDYEAQVRPPGRLDIASTDNRYELVYSANPGSGGEAVSLAVAILSEVYRVENAKSEADVYHATAEALKFAFARRSLLNDTGKGKPPLVAPVGFLFLLESQHSIRTSRSSFRRRRRRSKRLIPLLPPANLLKKTMT